MSDPFISEVRYLGTRDVDFVEIAVDAGTDVSDITVTIYNQNGTVRSTNTLGSLVTTIDGKDVYIVNEAPSSNFNGLSQSGGVAVDVDGVVTQFISFNNAPAITPPAGNGPAAGISSTQIGRANRTESLVTTDGGLTYTPTTNITEGSVPCFARGTHIETITGPKQVQALRVGDLLKTHTGSFVPVKLILSTHVSPRRLALNPNLLPICISAGSLGHNRPKRDLFVSPQHRILVKSAIVKRMFDTDEALVAAVRLTDLPGIFQVNDIDEVDYFHIIADQHEILISEGIPSESFLIGPETAKILKPEQIREIRVLFPGILSACAIQPHARFIPSRKRQKKLIMRHAKNDRPILAHLN